MKEMITLLAILMSVIGVSAVAADSTPDKAEAASVKADANAGAAEPAKKTKGAKAKRKERGSSECRPWCPSPTKNVGTGVRG